MKRLLALLPLALLASCQVFHKDDPIARGKAVFEAYNCQLCHTVGGQGGTLGPDLTFVGFRKEAAFLDAWLKDPHAWKKHVSMPNFRLADRMRADLVAYLASLDGSAYLNGRKPWDEKAFHEDSVARGREIYSRVGCVTCHGKDGSGGYPNNNVVGGLIPALKSVADGYSREELIDRIRKGVRHPAMADPEGPEPLLYMPRWEAKLKAEEIEAVADYLLSLKPAGGGGDAW